jgi:hypothetical protein
MRLRASVRQSHQVSHDPFQVHFIRTTLMASLSQCSVVVVRRERLCLLPDKNFIPGDEFSFA